MSRSETPDTGRRNFLMLGATVAPAALAAATGGSAEAAEAPVVQTGFDAELKDTPHTRAYFASARF